jgi:hypothetical protein
VSPRNEYFSFLEHAENFSYEIFWNDYTEQWVQDTVEQILQKLPLERGNPGLWTNPVHYTLAPRVVVGEAKNPNDASTLAGAWLPFTSARMSIFVQKYFGNDAFQFAWTNAEDFLHGKLDLKLLRGAAEIFTFGETAAAYVKGKGFEPKASFAHPAFFSRWNTERGRSALAKFETEYKKAFQIK